MFRSSIAANIYKVITDYGVHPNGDIHLARLADGPEQGWDAHIIRHRPGLVEELARVLKLANQGRTEYAKKSRTEIQEDSGGSSTVPSGDSRKGTDAGADSIFRGGMRGVRQEDRREGSSREGAEQYALSRLDREFLIADLEKNRLNDVLQKNSI